MIKKLNKEEAKKLVEEYIERKYYYEALKTFLKYRPEIPEEKIKEWIRMMIEEVRSFDCWRPDHVLSWIDFLDYEECFWDDLPFLLQETLEDLVEGTYDSVVDLRDWVEKTGDKRLEEILNFYEKEWGI